MNNEPRQRLPLTESIQLLGGAALLEVSAFVAAYGTLDVIEAGEPNSAFRVVVGALGTAAMAGSGGLLVDQWRKLRSSSPQA